MREGIECADGWRQAAAFREEIFRLLSDFKLTFAVAAHVTLDTLPAQTGLKSALQEEFQEDALDRTFGIAL